MGDQFTVSPRPLVSVRTGLSGPLGSCRAEFVDGWLVHSAALAEGLDTLLFPGQVLILDEARSGGHKAFAHGVPNESRLSAASFVQDNRIRRELVETRGIPVPRARAFPVRGGVADALSFAEEIGYPVVVKPMMNDSTTEVMPNITSPEQLQEAIQYLTVVPTLRPNFTAASYSITQAMTPRTAGSRRTRKSYRFMVEGQVSGAYLRLLIIEDQLVSVIYAPDGPWAVESFRDVIQEVDPWIEELAGRISRSYPGLTVMAADVVVADWVQDAADDEWHLVELSERPWLYVQYLTEQNSGMRLGQYLLNTELKRTSPYKSITDENRAVSFAWEGVSQSEDVLAAVSRISSEVGLRGWCEVLDEVNGVVGGQWEGSPYAIALLNELAVAGELLPEAIVCSELRVVEETGTKGFIRR